MAISLGKLIRLLEAEKQDNIVSFDFCGFVPHGLGSYRGFYDQLAMGFSEYKEPAQTVADLLKELRAANGQIFTGYKGGEYRMDLDTHVWVANYGESSQTAITGLADCVWKTVISTGFDD